MSTTHATRVAWAPVIERARAIVEESVLAMTLRMLFYRLVSEHLIPNTQSAYSHLSRLTARGRRDGTFPRFVDPTRTIHQLQTFASPEDARGWLASIYRRDRTEGQDVQIVVGVEKATQQGLLAAWFEGLGVPIVPLRGYSSQTYVDEILDMLAADRRPSVLVYAGDFDPSGEDILRDFRSRAGDGFDEVRHVALSWEQVVRHALPPQVGKATDSRAASFAERHGRLVQVELEALPPEILRDLYRAAIADYWDDDAYRSVLERERAEREELR